MIYIVGALLLYTIAILLGAAAARNANTNLVSLITSALSVLVPAAVVAPHLSKKAFTSHKFGIIMAVLGGIVVGLFVMALNKSFAENKIGIVAPIVFGGAIFLSTLLSLFVFKERIGLIEGIGLAILGIGFIIIIYARATA
ncbi:MAG: hypothetical protein Q7R60_01965 [bacterium]|nr:hypothetical protein [bacterium]